MEMQSPGELVPAITSLYAWKDKEQFATPVDRSKQWVLFIVEKGKFHFEIGSEQGIATDRQFVLCPPETSFRREMIVPTTFFSFIFHWYTHTGTIVQDDQALLPNPSGQHAIHDTQRLADTCKFILKIIHRLDASSVYRKNFLLQDIWQLYCWEWEKAKEGHAHNDKLMIEAEETMRANVFKGISLTSLSRELGLSSVQFTRRFKAAFQVTPLEYMTEIKLNYARVLLVESSLTLSEIAAECGYENGFYLSRLFSKKMNMSPSQYRQMHRM